MVLQCLFYPPTTKHAFAIIEHRGLSWCHGWVGFLKPDLSSPLWLCNNTGRNGWMARTDFNSSCHFLCRHTFNPTDSSRRESTTLPNGKSVNAIVGADHVALLTDNVAGWDLCSLGCGQTLLNEACIVAI